MKSCLHGFWVVAASFSSASAQRGLAGRPGAESHRRCADHRPSDKDLQSGNMQKAIDLVDAKVLPHFDFPRMTALAIGQDWREATPEQKTTLSAEFKILLVRTYSNALTAYRDQTVRYKPALSPRYRCDSQDRGRAGGGTADPARLFAGEAGRRLEGLRCRRRRGQPGDQLSRHLRSGGSRQRHRRADHHAGGQQSKAVPGRSVDQDGDRPRVTARC